MSDPTNEDEIDRVAAAPDRTVYVTGTFEGTATPRRSHPARRGRIGCGAVATGWFAGTVDFGPVTLTSDGPSNCVIALFRPDGSTRWAHRLGGPGAAPAAASTST